jgi:hypothetical protein
MPRNRSYRVHLERHGRPLCNAAAWLDSRRGTADPQRVDCLNCKKIMQASCTPIAATTTIEEITI